MQEQTTSTIERPGSPPVLDHAGVRVIQGLAVALAVLFLLAALRTAGPQPYGTVTADDPASASTTAAS